MEYQIIDGKSCTLQLNKIHTEINDLFAPFLKYDRPDRATSLYK
jgi:hypothetical protein